MAQVNINMQKVAAKWNPVLDKMGINNAGKREWMAEYAEYHQLTENVGYANLGNISGMGSVISPIASQTPGQTGFGTGVAGSAYGNGGAVGSGDYGQQLLPVAMKVAAQTIGLDLVSVKPSAGPVIDLMYVDYRYDDGPLNSDDYNPLVFKIDTTDAGVTLADFISEMKAILVAQGIRETNDGLTGRIFFTFAANGLVSRAAGVVGANPTIEPTNKEGVIEFLGFSRIDGKPMFRSYRTTNAAPQGQWKFSKSKNTFGEMETIVNAFSLANGAVAGTVINTSGYVLGFGATGLVAVELVSALEDHIPGFSTNGLKHGMPRQVDEQTYPGIIAPNVTTKRVQVGTVEVSSALKITEIEDIKAQTGIDIVQKLESVLVNELSQTISKEIVAAIFAMGEENRKSAPGYSTGTTKFDFDVDAYFSGLAPGGETTQSSQRKLITKVKTASYFISSEGRVGPATFAVTNGNLAAVLTEGAKYTLQTVDSSINGSGQMYPVGTVDGITIYVDPNMKYDDDRIVLGRKNNPDQPGVIFVPYLMAQSISLISEATFAPRMLLRSRYAVTEVGFFPQKQYMAIHVTDTNGYLS